MITQEELKQLVFYDKETGVFTRLSSKRGDTAYKPTGTLTNKGYVLLWVCGKLYKAHRMAWLYEYGTMPIGEIDHINGIKSDNRISNLRDVTRSENNQNRKAHNKNNKNSAMGVRQNHIGKYVAAITINRKAIHLGCFSTIEEASAAYKKAKAEYHPFAPDVITSRKQPF
jgi:hypothetical protein